MNVGDSIIVPPSALRYGGTLIGHPMRVVKIDKDWVTLFNGSTYWPFKEDELIENK